MRKFRKIVVDNTEYKWLFRYDDYDYQNAPYLLIVMNERPKTTLQIIFPIKEHFLLNSGLLVVYQGNQVVLNLNQPVYVAQIIGKCREMGEDFTWDGYKRLNGIDILDKIGFEINPIFL